MHVSKHMRSFHWLPVKSSINFKICVIFKTMLYGSPCMCMIIKLVPYTCAVNTRHSNLNNMILKTADSQQYQTESPEYFGHYRPGDCVL